MIRLKEYKPFMVLVLVLLVTAWVLSSCSEDMMSNGNRPCPMVLEASSNTTFTRAGTAIQGRNFDAGESIYAFFTPSTGNITNEDGNNISNPLRLITQTTNAQGVNPLVTEDNKKLYYPAGDNVKVSIYALYPEVVENTFSVRSDQQADADYKASDLMYASTLNHPKGDQAIQLQFQHMMAKLIINAKGVDGVVVNSVTLKNVDTNIGFTPSTGELGSLSGQKQDMTISKEGAVLIPPQTINSEFLEVHCNTSDVAKFFVSSKEFKAGHQYTVNLAVGPKNFEAGGLGDVIIEPWPEAAGTINVAAVGSSGLAISDIDDVTYNGSAFEPNVTVTDGAETPTTLSKNTDYTLEYFNNVNAGTALVVAKGVEGTNYEGITSVKSFVIKKASNPISYPSTDYTTTLVKNGVVANALNKPSPKSDPTEEKWGVLTFKVYSDAAMTVEHPTSGDNCIATVDANGDVRMQKKGTVWVKATMNDSGNFEEKTVSYKLTINAGVASQVMRVVLKQSEFTYTGSTITPEYDVYDGTIKLVLGIDYKFVQVKNAINAAKSTDATHPTLVIEGIGEYTGQKEEPFTINPATTVITVNRESKIIDNGKTYNCGFATNFGTLTYTSSNTTYVTVSNGTVTGKALSGNVTATGVENGYITITASVAQGTNWTAATKTIKIRVEEMYKKFDYVTKTYTDMTPSYTYTLNNSKTAKVTFELVGGGGGCDGGGAGGHGGLVKAYKNFEPGQVLYIYVGGGGISQATGGTGGGWNGGGMEGKTGSSGGGGGASDIRIGGTGCGYNTAQPYSTTPSTDNRVLVAGGAGGSSLSNTRGGSGGDGTSGQATFAIRWRGDDKVDYSGTAPNFTFSGTAVDGGGGGGGYIGGSMGADNQSGGGGGSNYIAPGYTTITNGTSTNGPSSGTDTAIKPGWVIISYEYEDEAD